MPTHDTNVTPPGDPTGDHASTISHAHARALACLWAEGERPDFSITVLARTGAIRTDTAAQLERDLRLLTDAARAGGAVHSGGVTPHGQASGHLRPESIPQRQIHALLAYVRYYGVRDPIPGWRDLADDGEFTAEMRRLARARRSDTESAHAMASPSLNPIEGRGHRAAAPSPARRMLRLVRWEPDDTER